MKKLWFNRYIHNLLIHPLVVLLPNKTGKKLHNWHSDNTWGRFNRDIWIIGEDLEKYKYVITYEKNKAVRLETFE